MSKKALGRGIEALIKVSGDKRDISSVSEVPIDSLHPNPYQPRKEFDSEALKELANSIKQKGVLQPVLVESAGEGMYIIIAGERRVRAAKMAGLTKIPIIVKQFSEEEKLEIALIENVQREDLSPLEEAYAYKRLIDISKLSQEEIAVKVGKNRSTVANSLRLLKLPDEFKRALEDGRISSGHARAILMLDSIGEQKLLFDKIVSENLSVRQAERLASSIKSGEFKESSVENAQGAVSNTKRRGESSDGSGRRLSPELRDLENRLLEIFGTKVSIKGSNDRGKIEISYFSLDDLNRILDIIEGNRYSL